MSIKHCIVFLIFLLLSPNNLLAGKLDEFEEQYEDPEKPRDKREETEQKPDYPYEEQCTKGTVCFREPEPECDTVGDCVFEAVFGDLLEIIIVAPVNLFLYPVKYMEKLSLNDYPYQYPKGAYFRSTETPGLNEFGFETSLAYQRVRDNLHGTLVGMELNSVHRWGLKGEALFYTENHLDDTDHLKILTALVNLFPVQTPSFVFDYSVGGIGIWGKGQHSGSSFSLGALYFPLKPLIIESRTTFSWVSTRPLWDLSVQAGMNYQHLELFGGYRAFIGRDEKFGGPYGGLRIWF